MADVADKSAVVILDEVERRVRFNAQEGGGLVLSFEVLDHLRQAQVRKTVRVIGQKNLVVAQEFLHRAKALPDIRVEAGVGEGNIPVLDVVRQQLQLLTAV